jgi:hypothetical protein
MASIEFRIQTIGCAVVATTLLLGTGISRADEGGVSFWLPGQYASFAAAPQVPGWALGVIYYHTNVSAFGNVAASKEIIAGRIPVNVNVNLNLSLAGQGDLIVLAPSYTFAQPVLGGQLSLSVSSWFGRDTASIAGTLTASTGSVFATRTGMIQDALTSYGDIVPTATLRWNSGVNNFMTYVTGDIPVGDYNPMRLSNIGIGHGTIDSGGAYTYLNPATGNEFSAVAGLTYNFKNPDTQYRSGIDVHFDWGAAHFISKQVFNLQACLHRDRGICLSANYRRLRSKPDSGRLQVARSRRRPADWIQLPRGRHAGVPGPQGLWRFRCSQPRAGLEHVADICDFAGGAHGRGAAEQAGHHEIGFPGVTLVQGLI